MRVLSHKAKKKGEYCLVFDLLADIK